MRRSMIYKTRSWSGMLAVGLSLMSIRAFAVTLPGLTGHGYGPPEPFMCMTDYHNGTLNLQCDGTNGTTNGVPWEVLLPVNPGTHTVTIAYYNPPSNGNFNCFLNVLDPATGHSSGTTFPWGGLGYTTSSATATVPTGGQLYIDCVIPSSYGVMLGMTYDE